MGNITPTMDHYPRNELMEETDLHLICHVNPGMSNLLSGFRVVLESVRNNS